MATLSQRAAASSLRLIAANGLALTLSRRGSNAVFNPSLGEYTSSGTVISSGLSAVVLPFTTGQIRDSADGRGADVTYEREMTKGSLRKLLVSALSTTFMPEPGDEVAGLESNAWEVLGCVPLAPAGTPILYTIVVRKK